MSAGNPRVSVVMACHDSAAWLDEAVGSVLAQTFRDLELILVDDASTDATPEKAERHARQDGRVRVLRLARNGGPAVARNAGFDVAKGEWIAVLDSDDVADPDRLREQVGLADRLGDAVLVASDAVSTDAAGVSLKSHRYPTDHARLVGRLETLGAVPPHSSVLYRKSATAGGFNPRFVPSEDYDFWLRMSARGKLASVARPLVRIRRHAASQSNLESGLRQIRLGHGAIVCHFLRSVGGPDPSVSGDETEWTAFVTWLDARLDAEGTYAWHRTRARARACYYESRRRWWGAARSAVRILGSPRSWRGLFRETFGSALPRRLAGEWTSAGSFPRTGARAPSSPDEERTG